MPLIPVAVVGAYALGVPIVFAGGDDSSPSERDSEEDTTLALATALACNITLNGVPLNVEPAGFDRWWLSGTEVHGAPLADLLGDD
jgi:hypothetical protein